MLFLAGLLQASFVPLNLMLLLLLCRSFAVPGKGNLFLSFGAGLFLAILESTNLGFYPLAFLILVKLAQLARQLPVSKNIYLVAVVATILILLFESVSSLFLGQTMSMVKVAVEIILFPPLYLGWLFWEERFSPKGDIKLKVAS